MMTPTGLRDATRPVVRVNGHHLPPPTGAHKPIGLAAPASVQAAQADADLARTARRMARVRQGFYGVVLGTALAGQVSGAVEALHIPIAAAIPAVGALELGGVVVLGNADVRRRLGERAVASRLLSVGIAAGAVSFNWLAHSNFLLRLFFAGMSALGYLVWLMHTENQRRDRLRATGDLPPTTPAYELVGHWLRHPWVTGRARSLAKANPGLGLYDSLAAARAEINRERRHSAIARVLHRKIRASVDPNTADIAVQVYDLEQIAQRLAAAADYDGLTALIAEDLEVTRLASPADAPPAGRRATRRVGQRNTKGSSPGRAAAGAGQPPIEGSSARRAGQPQLGQSSAEGVGQGSTTALTEGRPTAPREGSSRGRAVRGAAGRAGQRVGQDILAGLPDELVAAAFDIRDSEVRAGRPTPGRPRLLQLLREREVGVSTKQAEALVAVFKGSATAPAKGSATKGSSTRGAVPREGSTGQGSRVGQGSAPALREGSAPALTEGSSAEEQGSAEGSGQGSATNERAGQ